MKKDVWILQHSGFEWRTVLRVDRLLHTSLLSCFVFVFARLLHDVIWARAKFCLRSSHDCCGKIWLTGAWCVWFHFRAIYFYTYARTKNFCNSVMRPETPLVHICSASAAGESSRPVCSPFLTNVFLASHAATCSLLLLFIITIIIIVVLVMAQDYQLGFHAFHSSKASRLYS